jgi:competence/damage-inducible protein CinA-like protein
MKCAIIAIGDELTTGTLVDSNSAWISDRLLALGIKTVLHMTVADEMEDIVDAFKVAGERAKQVIVTGGLGPTEDDLTKDAFCDFAKTGTTLDQKSLNKIEVIFKALDRPMTENNIKQAYIPDNCEIIRNSTGTAPGFMGEVSGTTYYFLPGVPRECKMMMKETVLPTISKTAGGPVLKTLTLRTFGMTESGLDQELSGIELPKGARLGYRATFPEIHLKIYAEAENEDNADMIISKVQDEVQKIIGDVIYSEDGRSLEEVVLALCIEKNIMLAIAESCTGGLITKRLTDINGSSKVVDRGFVTYSNEAKTDLLGVDKNIIETHGAVSSECAREMVKGALENSQADLALSVTGIAGPTGGTPERPVGTVHIAVADKDSIWDEKFIFARWDRTLTRELTAQAALEIIRRKLLGLTEYTR